MSDADYVAQHLISKHLGLRWEKGRNVVLSMKISRIVDLHAGAGWRVFSFLKIETDAGLIGWSEYNESYGAPKG
jgi:hypothetical protein